MKKWFLFFFLSIISLPIFCQSAPAEDENIPYLMTFGKKAETSWGDDDFVQTFFFLIPEKFKKPIYINANAIRMENEGKMAYMNPTVDACQILGPDSALMRVYCMCSV